MSRNVRLKKIEFRDRTGFATHAQFELLEYNAGRIGTRAFTVPLRLGYSGEFKPYSVNVYEMHVQPIVSTRPGEFMPIGQPLSVRAPSGYSIVSASFVSQGELIRRTLVDDLLVSPEDIPDETIEILHVPPQVLFDFFDYHDVAGGLASEVAIELFGSKNDNPPQQHNPDPAQVMAGVAEWQDKAYSDIEWLRFTPRVYGGGGYGDPVTQKAVGGLFLKSVSGRNTGSAANPVNKGACTLKQPGTYFSTREPLAPTGARAVEEEITPAVHREGPPRAAGPSTPRTKQPGSKA